MASTGQPTKEITHLEVKMVNQVQVQESNESKIKLYPLITRKAMSPVLLKKVSLKSDNCCVDQKQVGHFNQGSS